jgi:ice-binding like protein
MAVLLGIVPAAAYWAATGSGSTSATTSRIAVPVDVTVPATAATNVAVSWTPGTGGTAVTGYYVTRHSGTTTAAACASSPITLLTAATCTDAAVPDGTYTYVVTAAYASWTTASIASAAAIVVNASALVLTSPPTDTLAGDTIAPPVTVALRTAGGAAFPAAGYLVTVAIGTNPAGGTLTGTTVVATDDNGVASFGDLSIDTPGTYTLTATSPGLVSATSATFTMTAASLLGAAQGYSVLAATTVANTGATTLSGDLGVSPGTAVTGFPPGIVGGDVHVGDADAAAAQTALVAAYDELAGRTANLELTGEIGGLTLTAGVYHATAALAVTGTVTLDGEGDTNAVFIFQTDAAFNTAAASLVNLVNGATADNVFWVVNAAAGTGANSSLSGTILAHGAITLGASTTLVGHALSRDAVTLAGDTLTGVTPAPPASPMRGAAAPPEEAAPVPLEPGLPDPSGDLTETVPEQTEPVPSDSPASAEPDVPQPTPTTSAAGADETVTP